MSRAFLCACVFVRFVQDEVMFEKVSAGSSISGGLCREGNKANRILGLIRQSYEHLDCESPGMLFTAFVRRYLQFGNSLLSSL